MALQPLVKFRQFCDVQDASMQGKKRGDKFHWNTFSDVATQGGAISETDVTPETNFTITQGELTITELTNSVPFSQKLDNLSEQPIREIITKVLKNDAKKAFDIAAKAQFQATPLYIAPTSGTSTTALTLTTNGATATVNNVELGTGHVKAAVDLMKERNIPPYQGDDYFALGHPSTFRPLKNSLETLHQYTDQGFVMIMNGEIGRYEGVRFIEQTNVAKETWSNAKSNWAYFFGQDTVAEGIAVPEEIRGKLPGDYGRDMGIAWYYLGGFGLVHPVAADARILKWASVS